ncbi:MAG: hypothetical protein PVG21_03480 [Gammaproteobacteria bacterium]
MPPARADFPLTAEPDPFRLDAALEGRDFRYNNESFMHRFGYMPGIPLDPRQPLWRDGIFGTVGSVRSKEFYSLVGVRASGKLGETTRMVYRFRRDEDFDGRFDRNLVGLEQSLPRQWRWSILINPEAVKANDDLQVELAWQGAPGHQFRIAYVLVDPFYSGKTPEARYERQPRTVFAEYRWQGDSFGLYTFVNDNLHTSYRDLNTDFLLDYGQSSGGLALAWQFPGGAWLQTAVQAENGWRRGLMADGSRSDFHRRFRTLTTVAGRPLTGALEGWAGLRLLYLDEDNPDGLYTEQPLKLRFRQAMLMGGISWPFRPGIYFRPAIYANRVDNENAYAGTAPTREKRWVGKLALPVEWRWGADEQKMLSFGLTFHLHKNIFGGANMQVLVPFEQ